MKARELNQNWTMRCVEDLQWQEAIVPGTVYTDLLRNGNMENPVRTPACRGSGSGMRPVFRPFPSVPAAPTQGQNRVSGKTCRLGTASAHLPP